MFQETLQTNIRRLMNFLGFARAFVLRNNPIKKFINSLIEMIKNVLTIKKKIKMARYRLNYHQHQLNRMETLIAQNNEHTFLRGSKLNETR